MSSGNDGFSYRPRLHQRVFDRIAAVVDWFVPWYRLPALLGAFNLAVFRDRLRQRNLHHTGYGVDAAPPWQPGYERFRSPDGSYNSLDHPRMGMAQTRFGRNVPLRDSVPEPEPGLLDPSPRLISNELLRRRQFKPATTLNLLSAAWIQFQVHDWFFHGKPVAQKPFAIPLAPGDDWPCPVGGQMHIRRSTPDKTPRESFLGSTPTFPNEHSHWWDATQLYGPGAAAQIKLRTHIGGLLRLGADGLLPEDPDRPGADLTGFNDNWWIGLSLLHNLFAREHNAICAALKQAHGDWDDEELFQHARLINAALIAKIHTVEWTPAILAQPALDFGMHANWSGVPSRTLRAFLGRDSEVAYGIPGSHADQHSAPYAMTEEFIAVYRMHPLIPDDLAVHSIHGLNRRSYPLTEIHGQNSRAVLDRHGLADLIYSFGIAHPGAITVGNYPDFLRRLKKPDEPLMDLAAVDIMRDRERGVPRYNRFRELIGKHRARSFSEITSDAGLAAKLREIYRGDIERVDLMVGLMAEDLPPGFGFSDTAFRVFILMASRRLKSDRFYTDDFRPEIYTDLGMAWIRNNTMKSVLLRHLPELAPAFEGVINAFAPWQPLVRTLAQPVAAEPDDRQPVPFPASQAAE